MTTRLLAALLLPIALAMPGIITGCSQNAATSPPPPASQETYVFGTLKSGFAGIGGEHTGWALEQSGGNPPLEVDVSTVLTEARALDGMTVSGWGTVYTKKYVERGPTLILKFSRLQRMPDPTPPPAGR